jgi:hypothetical protein
MESILSSIITALVAGATAIAEDVASDGIKRAYQGLKSLIIQKLGKSGAVQSVEDEPDSEAAQATLAETLSKANLHSDEEVKKTSDHLNDLIAKEHEAGTPGLGNIDIEAVRGRINALVEDLAARGNVTLGPVIAETGDATVRRVSAGYSGSSQEDHSKN